MAGGERGLVRLDLEQIGARRVEQTVAHHGADRSRRDHRLGDQAVDGIEQARAVDALVRHDFERGVDGEVTGEDGKPAQHEALGVGQEPVAPVQRRLQRLLPRRRGALALPEQIEAFVEQCGRLLQSVGLLQLWGLFEIAMPDLLARRVRQRHRSAHPGRVEIRRASPEIAIGLLLHRTVVVAQCDSTDSTSSAMIETLGAK
ncbi:hypothetical protein J4G48_0005865 [Bradyrhizobium barranii subsp. apii]|uniref:hypothetical protein n=1 Tax=Bradyrhizobium barranii TaxID=2992140 RepID=UPI002064C688|nr:hypothetical protein [Bradyrhizobium barranii]UPT97650.1 hypothetical protein J4G48_0005865 [Bradyrhizobium barranii subsp. apii]